MLVGFPANGRSLCIIEAAGCLAKRGAPVRAPVRSNAEISGGGGVALLCRRPDLLTAVVSLGCEISQSCRAVVDHRLSGISWHGRTERTERHDIGELSSCSQFPAHVCFEHWHGQGWWRARKLLCVQMARAIPSLGP